MCVCVCPYVTIAGVTSNHHLQRAGPTRPPSRRRSSRWMRSRVAHVVRTHRVGSDAWHADSDHDPRACVCWCRPAPASCPGSPSRFLRHFSLRQAAGADAAGVGAGRGVPCERPAARGRASSTRTLLESSHAPPARMPTTEVWRQTAWLMRVTELDKTLRRNNSGGMQVLVELQHPRQLERWLGF